MSLFNDRILLMRANAASRRACRAPAPVSPRGPAEAMRQGRWGLTEEAFPSQRVWGRAQKRRVLARWEGPSGNTGAEGGVAVREKG